jgi:hypothetical protein
VIAPKIGIIDPFQCPRVNQASLNGIHRNLHLSIEYLSGRTYLQTDVPIGTHWNFEDTIDPNSKRSALLGATIAVYQIHHIFGFLILLMDSKDMMISLKNTRT